MQSGNKYGPKRSYKTYTIAKSVTAWILNADHRCIIRQKFVHVKQLQV